MGVRGKARGWAVEDAWSFRSDRLACGEKKHSLKLPFVDLSFNLLVIFLLSTSLCDFGRR